MASTFQEEEQDKKNNEITTVSPLGAATQGASKNAAQMAHTPQAVKKRVFEQPTEQVRETEARTYETAETRKARLEQAGLYGERLAQAQEQLKENESLKNLGSIGDSLRGIISEKIQLDLKDSLTAEGELADEGRAVISALSEATDKMQASEEVKNKFKELYAAQQEGSGIDEAGQVDLVGQIAGMVGETDANGKLTLDWDNVKELFPSEEEAVGAIVAAGLGDLTKVDKGMLNAIGYSDGDISEVYDTLGISEETPITISELERQISAYIKETYEPLDKELRKLSDRNLTRGERLEVLETLKDAGYLGTLANRQEIDNIAAKVETGLDKEIEFDGESFGSLEELLSRDGMAGLIGSYLDGTITAEVLPDELVSFINENKEVMQDIMTTLEGEVTEFKDVQESWKDVVELDVNEDLKNSLFNITSEDQGKAYYTDKYDRTTATGLGKRILTAESELDKLNVVSLATDLHGMNIDDEARTMILQGLDDTEIDLLLSDPEAKTNYMRGIELGQRFDDLSRDPELTGIGAISGMLGVNEADLTTLLDDLEVLERLGVDEATGALDMLDSMVGQPGSGVLTQFDGLLNYGDVGKVRGEVNALDKIMDTINKAKTSEDMAVYSDVISHVQGEMAIDNRRIVSAIDGLMSDEEAADVTKVTDKYKNIAGGTEGADARLEGAYITQLGDASGIDAGTARSHVDNWESGDFTIEQGRAMKSFISNFAEAATIADNPWGRKAREELNYMLSGIFGKDLSSQHSFPEVVELSNIVANPYYSNRNPTHLFSVDEIPAEFMDAFKMHSSGKFILKPVKSIEDGKDIYRPAVQEFLGVMLSYQKLEKGSPIDENFLNNFGTYMKLAKASGVKFPRSGKGEEVKQREKTDAEKMQDTVQELLTFGVKEGLEIDANTRGAIKLLLKKGMDSEMVRTLLSRGIGGNALSDLVRQNVSTEAIRQLLSEDMSINNFKEALSTKIEEAKGTLQKAGKKIQEGGEHLVSEGKKQFGAAIETISTGGGLFGRK